MAFTLSEQARILHFLSYPKFSSLSQSIQLGYPAASEPLFLVEDAFKRITPEGEVSIRIDLCECEGIEKQLSQARGRFKATQLGELKVNENEAEQLRRELRYWSARLASDLGVNANPYSSFENLGEGQGGVNARVMG
jgi:hypothetical protein